MSVLPTLLAPCLRRQAARPERRLGEHQMRNPSDWSLMLEALADLVGAARHSAAQRMLGRMQAGQMARKGPQAQAYASIRWGEKSFSERSCSGIASPFAPG